MMQRNEVFCYVCIFPTHAHTYVCHEARKLLLTNLINYKLKKTNYLPPRSNSCCYGWWSIYLSM